MRDSLRLTFLTFVLIFYSLAHASPSSDPIESDSQRQEERLGDISDPQLALADQLGPRPKSQLKATMTSLIGDLGQESNSDQQIAYGLSYANEKSDLISYEWQAHATTEKIYWLQWSERQLLSYDSLYEPYYKYGLSFFGDPEDGLGSFTRINNYFVSGTVGMLDVGQIGQIFTFEMGLSLGTQGAAFHIQGGLQYSF